MALCPSFQHLHTRISYNTLTVCSAAAVLMYFGDLYWAVYPALKFMCCLKKRIQVVPSGSHHEHIYSLLMKNVWFIHRLKYFSVVLGRDHTRKRNYFMTFRRLKSGITAPLFLSFGVCVCVFVLTCVYSLCVLERVFAHVPPHTWLVCHRLCRGSPKAGGGVLPYQIFVTSDSCLSERIFSDTAECALQRLAWVMRSLLTLVLPDSDFSFGFLSVRFWSCFLSSFCSLLFSYQLCSFRLPPQPHKQHLKSLRTSFNLQFWMSIIASKTWKWVCFTLNIFCIICCKKRKLTTILLYADCISRICIYC